MCVWVCVHRSASSGSCWSQRIGSNGPGIPSAAEPAGAARPQGLTGRGDPSEPWPGASAEMTGPEEIYRSVEGPEPETGPVLIQFFNSLKSAINNQHQLFIIEWAHMTAEPELGLVWVVLTN